MPKKEHLPSVSAKEQRMYEHIKESETKQGRSTKSAKAIAAATVVKHHDQEDHAPARVAVAVGQGERVRDQVELGQVERVAVLREFDLVEAADAGRALRVVTIRASGYSHWDDVRCSRLTWIRAYECHWGRVEKLLDGV